MALEVIGGAFLSSLFQKMDSEEVKNFIRGKKHTEKLLKKLRIMLLSVNNVYNDAEDKQLTNSAVRKWLSDLTEAIFDAEDLLDKIKTEALRRKLEAADGSGSSTSTKVHQFLSDSFHAFDESVDTKIEEIIESLDFIAQQKDALELKTGARQRFSYTLPSTSLVEESSVYGRDEDKDTILKLLLANDPLPWVCDSDDFDATDKKIDVISIVGMGGIGKTTLAQLVYNDHKVTQHFHIRAWVCVSDDFDVLKITQTIYMSVPSRARCENPNDLNELQVQLKEALTGKKFLFVLDDVWNENYANWDFLSRPFESASCGSKIIVTTRNEGVVSVMGTLQTHHLRDICDEDCWLLFAKHAFGNKSVSAYPNLEVIGRKIVRKCKGLPLAAKSLGGLLRSISNEEEWKNVLESDIWELSEKECNILPALWLSYRYLPPHLKRCFAYSSIYPKDYEFEKNVLVLLWMAEDLLQPKKKKTMEEVGEDYFNDLISRSFFQEVRRAYDVTPVFTMHDLINDLAKFVSGDFCVRLEDNDSFNIMSKGKTRHFSYMEDDNLDLEKFDEAKCMRTFLPLLRWRGKSKIFVKVLPDLLLKLQCLRVLNLSEYAIRELPDSVSNLIHLRYLDLSYAHIEKLADAVCGLYNLQTLVLKNCKALAQLPTGLGRLIHLRHVDVTGTKVKKMPSQMQKMTNLQRWPLDVFVLDNETNIVDLKDLGELHGKLHIFGLDNIVDAGDALGANMREKKYLTELVLEWGGDTDDSRKDQQVLDNLRPHTNIRKVTIISYGGTNFPAWLGDDCFSNLVYVRLDNCANLVCFPDGGLHAPNLVEMWIENCKNLRSLPEEMRTLLPSLKDIGLPCKLETLSIFNCEKLVEHSMQWGLLQLTSPRHLYIMFHNCASKFPEELVLEWGGDTDDSRKDQLVLDNLRPHTNIRKVRISGYGGTNFPAWLGDDCFSNLVYVRLDNCANLVCFPDGGLHAPNLVEMWIENCKNLRSLPEEMRTLLPSLRDIVIRYCPELESFPEGGLPCKLETLSIFNCEKLVEHRMQWGLLQLTSLRHLYIMFHNCASKFPEEGLLPTTLTSLNFGYLSNLKTINNKELKRLISLQSLSIHNCPELLCLPDDGLPISLSYLSIYRCPLVKQRCNKYRGEDWPKIAHIPKTYIG